MEPEDEVRAQPLVSDAEGLADLRAAYVDNPVFETKLADFATKYGAIRRTRGDGSCYYRSFLISVGEHLVAARVRLPGAQAADSAAASPLQAHYEWLLKKVEGSLAALGRVGYADHLFTLEDFQVEMMNFVSRY